MAYNTKPIVTDVDGNPISQYYNKELDQYEPLEGQAGANKVVLYNADGTENNSLSLQPILDKLSQLTGTVIDEETRKSNELERIENEDTRQFNEDIRYTNEIERIENEDIRIENENTRINNENIRKANEQNRIDLYNDLMEKVSTGYFNGKNLEFHWNGTSLGVRVEGDSEYIYVDLKGETGDIENLTMQHVINALGYTPIKSVNNILADEAGNVELDIDISEIENRIGNVEDDLVAHKAEIATPTQLGHVKVGQNLTIDSDGTLNAQASDGKKVARFVIGTSTAGWAENDVDYLCDGVDDQEEINNAIQALPDEGGEIIILDGTYNITAKINVNKDNVSIRGSGNATILKRMWNSSSSEGVINLVSVEGCRIENLQIDGNKAIYTANYNCGIHLYSSSNNTITGNTCKDNDNGIFLSLSSNNNTIIGNTFNNNNRSIHLYSSNNNTITGNTCNNNNRGIFLYSSNNNTITGNTCNDNGNGIYLQSSSNNNTITGNICNNNGDGIHIRESSDDNTITGNTCNNNNRGIYLYSSNNNTITGNTFIRGMGTPEDYTTNQHTILLFDPGNNYNLITSNNCMGKAPVVQGGTGNTVFNNKWDASNDIDVSDIPGLVDTNLALGRNASAAGNYSVALGNGASAQNSNEGILGVSSTSGTSKWKVPGDFTVSGTKNFEIPHPKPEKKATHVIRHGAVESPTPGDTLYRWKVQATKDNDLVTIDLPDYFIYLNKDVQIWVTGQGHFGNGYGELNRETEQLEIHCQYEGEYNVLVIGTRNDDHQSVQDWYIKGVEREIGESWTGETYAFSVDEILEVEEFKEVSA